VNRSFEPVIGLEVHVQLATAEKLFCGCSTRFGAEPNSSVCPVCLGLPGALPVPNRRAVELAIRAARGLECAVHPVSVFARKNYVYPDLPKGYQITQFERPLATGGRLEVEEGGEAYRVRIRRLHLEEDAGRSLHDRFPGKTAVDLNRTGVPLAEIVTEPDLTTPQRARSFLDALKRLMEYLEVSDCSMEEGSLRVDANVSLRRPGEEVLGTKTELKNLNSFSAVERGLDREIERQARILEEGGAVVQETILYDEGTGRVRPMRRKEESHDYRYFPDPDLPPLRLASEWIEEVVGGLPESPLARRRRFREAYDLPDYDAGVLTADRELADFFEEVAAHAPHPKLASNWTMGPVLRLMNQEDLSIRDFPVGAAALGELLTLVDEGVVSENGGRRVLRRMVETGRSPGRIVEEEGLAQIRDEERLRGWVDEAIDAHPDEVRRYREGEEKLLGYLVGQVMRSSGGRADPRRVNALLREALEG